MKNRINRMRRRSGIVFGLFLIIAALGAGFVSSTDYSRTAFDNEDVQQLTDRVQVNCNGTVTECTLPETISATAGDVIQITKELDTDCITGNTIMFYVKQARVRVYLDEELLWEDEEWDVPIPMLEGIYWRVVRLPSDYVGRTLQIELVPQIDEYAGELPAIYSGTKTALIFMALRDGAIFLLLGAIAVVLGAAMLGIGLLMKREGVNAARMYYLGILSVLVGIWGVLEVRITQLFTGNIPLATFIVFACFAMFPVLITAFVLTYDSLRDRWYMKALFYLSVADFLIQQILQIAGILYYRQMVNAVFVMFLLIMVGLIAGFTEMMCRRDGVKEYFIYKILLVLGLFGIMDIIRYYFISTRFVGVFLRIGLLVFISALLYDTIRKICLMRMEEAKYSHIKELAFTDIMTGLENRTAFEHALEEIRSQQERESKSPMSWIIMIADMNFLKRVNDDYGHDKGDEAIFRMASELKVHFGTVGKCFRIGGDEFCVLAPEISVARFAQLCEEFRSAMETEATELSYPFSASLGYVQLDENGVDECLKKADAKMYEEKRSRGHARR